MKTTPVFDKLSSAWLQHPRYISSCGGTRSGKTFSILQLIYLIHLGEARCGSEPKITSVVSESMPHLKRGAVRDFKTILQSDDIWNDDAWNETDKTYRFANGGVIEFFSIDNAGKVFGASRDRLFINECQHIPSETARQLFVRTRDSIILDYNPTHSFWVNEKTESRSNCIRIHSTYKDNSFLTSEQVAEIESNRGDSNWWKVFGEGKVGTLEGVIYDFEEIDKMPEETSLVEFFGMDFGFTHDPTALVRMLADTRKKILYVDERLYRTRMLNSDIISAMKANGISRYTAVFADCAEPKSIDEIYRAGFNIKPCDKGIKIREQINYILGWQIRVTKRSLNLKEELRNYTWATDKDGRQLNEPIDMFNHGLDAMRYGLFTKLGRIGRSSGSKTSISSAW